MRKICLLAILLIVLSLGCSKDAVKPSEDSLITTEALAAIDSIKAAYEKKSETDLLNRMDSSLAASVIKNLYFERADLHLTPRLVTLTDTSVNVNLNWQGTWHFANDKEVKVSGVGNLVFHKETMKLISVDGDNPFLTPAIR